MKSLVAVALVLLLAACATTPRLPPRPPDPRTQMAALEQRIAVLIDDERSRINPNAKSLMIDPELTRVARERVADMANTHYFAHKSVTGDTSASILMAEDEHFQGLLGENMAAQYYTPAIGVDVEKFARAFVATWLNSPSHKENLSFPDYDRTGVGAAVNGNTVYVTQLFATDLGLGPHKDDAAPSVVTPLTSPKDANAPPPPGAGYRMRGGEGVAH